MRDFNNIHSTNRTEELLKSTDNTSMKVIVILLPPSEGGKYGNYDWKGWIRYFNSLKRMHRSFDGFTIDDFNHPWPMSHRTNYPLTNNVEYMIASKLGTLSRFLNRALPDIKSILSYLSKISTIHLNLIHRPMPKP
jgi:hypothetical protein